MSTIPISEVVRINPAVLPAGGSAVTLSGLILTTNTRVPIGTVAEFTGVPTVGNYFGEASVEANNAQHYFPGYLNSVQKPSKLRFVQYPLAAVGAYLRGGNLSGLTLTQLQAFNGTLSVTINSVLKTGSVNLSGATSFTNAAEIIANTLAIIGPPAASFTGVIAATVLTASAITGSPLAFGQVIAGAGVTAGTYILNQVTGPVGGAGTYNISVSQSVSSEAMTSTQPAVTFDSVSGAFVIVSPTVGVASTITFGTGAMATDLQLTSVLGAVLSQGANAAVPAAFMNTLVQANRSFSGWMLNFNPDQSGNDIRFAFATWNGQQNERYCYAAIDDDVAPAVGSAPASLADRITAAAIEGVNVNWQPPSTDINNPTASIDYGNLAAFVLGSMASLDFDQAKDRTTFKFLQQPGLTPGVTDQATFDNLTANGYNCYGAYGDGDDQFVYYANGIVSGEFEWMDTYCDQMGLNSAFRSALVRLLLSVGNIPYNAAGRALIESALAAPIQQFLAYGAYVAGVVLSPSQIADVNNAAGKNIADTLTNQGWYLDIGIATPEVRQARASPPMTFYYVDGESVQEFDMASIALL